MNWYDVETHIRNYIETQWALGSYSAWPLVFENENQESPYDYFVAVDIEGTYSEKGIYGGTNKRFSIEAGIVFIHVFGQTSAGKQQTLLPLVALLNLLELRTIQSVIDMDGANPPTPVHYGTNEIDHLISPNQPEGDYYRVSGSVPFIVRGAR